MIMSSVARVRFIKSKDIFRYHTKGVSNQASSKSDHKIKSYSCSISITKIGKNEKVEKIFLVTKRGNKGITNRARFQQLQIRARRSTNMGNFRNFKSGQKDYKSGQGFKIPAKRFQIGADITNWGRDYKSGQGLQIGAEQLKLSLFIDCL